MEDILGKFLKNTNMGLIVIPDIHGDENNFISFIVPNKSRLIMEIHEKISWDSYTRDAFVKPFLATYSIPMGLSANVNKSIKHLKEDLSFLLERHNEEVIAKTLTDLALVISEEKHYELFDNEAGTCVMKFEELSVKLNEVMETIKK